MEYKKGDMEQTIKASLLESRTDEINKIKQVTFVSIGITEEQYNNIKNNIDSNNEITFLIVPDKKS